MAENTCSIAGCDRPATCRGWCRTHYQRWRTSGVVGGPIQSRINGTPEERFWPKVDKNGAVPYYRPDLGQCWLFTAKARTPNGYPQFRCGGRMALAYRFAYEVTVGPIPEDLVLDHLCRVRHCVNPAHLEPVTLAENNARTTGLRNTNPECTRGHAYDQASTRWRGNKRVCRKCRTDRTTEWRRRKKML